MTDIRTPETRSCGDCQECCRVLAVNSETVSKPAWLRCRHQCATGCGVYEERPTPCAVYRCMWKLGWGPKNYRPDRLGLVVEAPGEGCGVFIKESRPGALRTKRGRKAFNVLAQQGPVFATHFGDEHVGVFTGTAEDLANIVNNIAHLKGTLGDAARRFMLEKAGLSADALADSSEPDPAGTGTPEAHG